jgi:MinD-like ATPase involved in chromosome partitioning or flagellar assembly
MELIAFASGKGGTGKTLMASCLGYALIRAGQRVLMIDADPATDGLSLFLLGPRGMNQVSDFTEENTFTGILRIFQSRSEVIFEPRRINRAGSDPATDHGVLYDAVISGKGLYGDISPKATALPDLDQNMFRAAVAAVFSKIREAAQYDYVLVDTRGGFAFESTDVCALADSFVVVTDPDVTSFYQDRNLVKRVSAAAEQLGSRPVLRSIIVNRATEGHQDGHVDLDKLEVSFRLQLEREFPVKFSDTHPIPADIEVLRAYKTQRVPYLAVPASLFSFATLSAFGEILKVVTARWTAEQVDRWNALVAAISEAVEKRNKQVVAERELQDASMQQLERLRKDNVACNEKTEKLTAEIARLDSHYQRELGRSEVLLKRVSTVPTLTSADAVGQKEYRPLSLRRQWSTLIISVSLVWVLSIPAWYGYRAFERSREQQRVETMLKEVYNPTVPPSLRSRYLRELITARQTDFTAINLMGLDLTELHSGTALSFRAAVLKQVDLSRSVLPKSDFTDANLQSAVLESVILRGSKFIRADFSGASLRNADLTASNMESAKFTLADLTGADLTRADLRDADFKGANLSGAHLTPAQLRVAIVDEGTILPDGARELTRDELTRQKALDSQRDRKK